MGRWAFRYSHRSHNTVGFDFREMGRQWVWERKRMETRRKVEVEEGRTRLRMRWKGMLNLVKDNMEGASN